MWKFFFFILNVDLVLVSLWNLSNGFLLEDAVTEATHQEVLKKWVKLEDGMIWLNGKLATSLEPHIGKIKILNVSTPCSESLVRSYNGLMQNKGWAIRLLDATGKPLAGILRNPSTFGSFYGCLHLQVPTIEEELLNKTIDSFNFNDFYKTTDFMGKYCLFDVRPTLAKRDRFVYNYNLPRPFNNMTANNELMEYVYGSLGHSYEIPIRTGLCLPNKCSDDDVRSVISIIMAHSDFFHISLHTCQEKPNVVLETHQIIIICVFSFFGVICSLATFFDYRMYGPGNKTEESNMTGAETEIFSAKQFAYIFSLRRNVRLVLSTKQLTDKKLSCLQGLRFIAFTWVVIGQIILTVDPFFLRNPGNLRNVYKNLFSQVFINTWAPIDVFFFMSGTLLSYIVVIGVDTKRTSLNVPKMILKRIWRLLPGELVVTGFMFLLPTVNYGPLWVDFFEPAAATCKKNWWQIFTFGQNFMNPNDTCLIHLWYVSVELQYLLVAIIYLVILFKNKSFANIFLVICIGFSVGFSTYLSYVNQLPPTMFPMYSNVPAMLEYAYFNHFLPHAHLCVYAIGLGTGTFVARTDSFNLSKVKQAFGWIHNTVVALFVCFGTYIWCNGREPSLVEGLSYTALHHVALAFALNWLVIMCATGNCYYINWILSWRVFAFLNRPSYMMYLFHYLVLQYYFKSMQGEQDFSYKILFFWHYSNMIAIYLGALVLAVFFDYPCQKIGSIVLNAVFKETIPVKKMDPPTPTLGEINVVFNMNEFNNQKNLEK